MTHHADVDSGHLKVVNSCLGQSLHRLQNNMTQVRQSQSRDEGEFLSWLKQWSKRSDQIAMRLELIDMQLDRMFPAPEPALQLRVIDADR
ncbi:hypothetical protein CA54_31230 [Symmachiella macrocystis]|uniref:Uncharacterized protein n=1 Tax=Symmachiella macrocystis TaxID=2527985 RepID=A0A5C6BU75_9PLAN|nr:hypothetical protein [Symmachiella macrocystis]TWU14279.1 hypothetical protein CA54_31230 [Symmachiella macrocystis]